MIYKDYWFRKFFWNSNIIKTNVSLFHKYLQNLNLKKIKNQDYLKFQI